MPDPTPVTVFLFTDIEGSTRLWERLPSRMHDALARHDAISAGCVTSNRGRVVKTTGDGIHAVFHDPLDAVKAAVAIQVALEDEDFGDGIAIRVRAGVHAGVESERSNDFYGTAVNRAARIMSAAHGGQVLVSGAVAALVRDRLPQDTSLRPLGRVRLRDLTEPEDVWQVAHPRLRVDFPALRSLESTPNNLPHGLTSFIGRERELAEVRDKLRATRLLTIVGIGGLGKSRLSLQVASAMLDDYPDGVWLVELAPVADPRLVAQTLASVLGIRDDAGQSPHDAIVKFVRDRRMLVILDNCEHLTQACAELARGILQSGARATILATSRERLGIGGEQAYPLAPFEVPPREPVTADALWAFASVRLLMERATAVRPDFAFTAENADAVSSICQQLDGIPLAIELAAARVRSMSAQRIAERLVDRFRLLSTGDRTALPRQQTLRALIDWSYDLLSPQEQTLFGRLAVFAGGFTLEAAETVASGAGVEASEVIELLAQLVEKSLVMFDTERDRYSLLDTVRQYALEHLRNSRQEEEIRERHLRHYLAFAETARPMLWGADQAQWLRRLDDDLENLLLAHAACNSVPQGAQLGLDLVFATKNYWMSRGLLRLGHGLTADALARADGSQDARARGRALFVLGQHAFAIGDLAGAQAALEQSLQIARKSGDRLRVADSLQPLGAVLVAHGDLHAARDHFEEALSLAREFGKTRDVASALTCLAIVHRLEGNLGAAQVLYRDALGLARELGDRASVAIGSINLAIVSIAGDRLDEAVPLLVEALDVAEETVSRQVSQSVLEVAAALGARRNDWRRSAALFGAADALAQTTGLQRDAADEKFLAPHYAMVREALGDELASVKAAGAALPLEDALAEARKGLSIWALH